MHSVLQVHEVRLGPLGNPKVDLWEALLGMYSLLNLKCFQSAAARQLLGAQS